MSSTSVALLARETQIIMVRSAARSLPESTGYALLIERLRRNTTIHGRVATQCRQSRRSALLMYSCDCHDHVRCIVAGCKCRRDRQTAHGGVEEHVRRTGFPPNRN